MAKKTFVVGKDNCYLAGKEGKLECFSAGDVVEMDEAQAKGNAHLSAQVQKAPKSAGKPKGQKIIDLGAIKRGAYVPLFTLDNKMADTRPNITLPFNQWVNLYAETGIAVGTRIAVENVGAADVYLTVSPTEPPLNYDAYCIVRRDGLPYANSQGDSGAWALCSHTEGKLNVREID